MKEHNEVNLEYLFDNTINVKEAYNHIVGGSKDISLFKILTKNYVKKDSLILKSFDRTERIKALNNVEFDKLSGKYYARDFGYVDYSNNSLEVLPVVNVCEMWRGIVVLVHHSNMLSYEDLENIIDRMNIKLAIDYDAIKKLYKEIKENEVFGDMVEFVSGKKPVNGTVAKVVIDIKIELLPGHENTDGSINFKERDFIHNVFSGEKIAHYSDAIESENGIDIYDEPIEAFFDNEVNYSLGNNVAVDDNGVDIISIVDGVMIVEDGVLSVDNTLEINRVDLATGNIDIQGTIVIKENVEPGFKIISESDIIIYGSVEDCLISSKGNLVVSSGILGASTSDINVAGDVHASFIRNAKIFARGDVTVVNQIINSDIIANGRVIVLEGKGAIIGGTVSAKKGVFAKVLGAVTDAATTVIAGQDVENETKYRRILDNIKSHQAEIARIKALLGNEYLRNQSQFLDRLTTAKKLEAYNFIDKIEILSSELKEMDAQRKEIYALFENATESVISIEKVIYPGVVVQIGVHRRAITQQITGTEFFYSKNAGSIFVKSPRKLTDKEYKKFDSYTKHLKKTDKFRVDEEIENNIEGEVYNTPDNKTNSEDGHAL